MKLNFNNIVLKRTAGDIGQLLFDGKPQAAFSGRSNVGKSSLVNCIANRKNLARVSSVPGKTITINYFEVDGKAYLVDLPGYGYAKRSEEEKLRWSNLVQAYLTDNQNLKVVVQLIDLKVGPTSDDLMMFDWLEHTKIPYIVVATKADKLNKTERQRQINALLTHPLILPETPIIPFSSTTKEGKDALLSELYKFFDKDK